MRDYAKLSLDGGSTKTPNQRWPSGSNNFSSRWRSLNSRPTDPCLFKDVTMATPVSYLQSWTFQMNLSLNRGRRAGGGGGGGGRHFYFCSVQIL